MCRLSSAILMLACHALFAASPSYQIAVGGNPNLKGHNSIKTVTCSISYLHIYRSDQMSCLTSSGESYSVPPTSCYLPNSNKNHNSMDQLIFRSCVGHSQIFEKVKADEFWAMPFPQRINVTSGKIIGNPRFGVPKTGLSCAWSDLRPLCDIPYP
ncbi:hypothetical protein O181_041485 [Austropuccinia psidii MF-1]|uniref:Uncharacterized protein n=1 Tax=Austropuccinia psidii MF-1 TaxID=1389203 RepID=A0A9Q3DIS3_9BASI|nr:hypothetical protein [Austropuccinia psidii MF-1]